MKGKWESASYAEKGADDLTFISDLLDQLDKNYCIDSDRVYASGKSNGGGFVDMMACSDLGDSFAAFAMASAALYSDTSYRDKAVNKCIKSRAILESHGGKDTTVPYTGQSAKKGTGGESPDIQDWLSWWARRDGCEKGEGWDKIGGERQAGGMDLGAVADGVVGEGEQSADLVEWDAEFAGSPDEF